MKLDRPPFILAFPGDIAGCGTHRIFNPLKVLGRLGIASARAETNFPVESAVAAMKPSAIIWQRSTETVHFDAMEKYRKAVPDALFVFEIDDALSSVPDSSWHSPYMTPNIDAKLKDAVSRCDVVTVTTQDLADHMHRVCGGPVHKYRVIANMLPKDEIELASQTRREMLKTPSKNPRLKVLFGGGISHTGDLALMNPVFEALKEDVEWCFLGMDPILPDGVKKSFFGSTAPDRYLASLAGINADLVIAPLEDNHFNRCKSNLRLIESGACLYPVIASPIAPYFTDSPPVFAYCSSPDEWIEKIRAFKALSPDERLKHGTSMFDWTVSRFCMDDHAERRLLAWLPSSTRLFKPKLNVHGSGVCTVSTSDELRAAFETSEDILYIRPGAHFDDANRERLLSTKLDVACAVTNDGGPWGFPSHEQFTVLDEYARKGISKVIDKFADAQPIAMAAVAGPAVLLRRSALNAIGLPDIDSYTVEMAILEWSCGARARGLNIGLYPGSFVGVDAPAYPAPGEAESIGVRIAGRWPVGQPDEPALRALREQLEIAFHRECYHQLPLNNRNDYPSWAELFDTRGEKSLALSHEWENNDKQRRPLVNHVQYPDTFERRAFVEWVIFTPANAALPEDWYQLFILGINKAESDDPRAAIVYTDHDYSFPNLKRFNPDFKPNFDLHMFLSRDYMTQAVAIRADLLPMTAEIDDSSLYAMLLDIIASVGRNHVHHLPRITATIPAPQVPELLQSAPLKHHHAKKFIERMGWNIDITTHENIPLYRHLHYSKRVAEKEPSVLIVIPCKDNIEMLAPCIATIRKMTTYKNYRIKIMDNGSTRQEMLDYLVSLSDDTLIQIERWSNPYNWSQINNVAVSDAEEEYFVFLNDDTRVLSPGWLSEMIGAASIPGVGAVGARLTYPHGLVQHVGVVAQAGLSGHIHKGLPINHPGTHGYAILSHESSCVTGACLAVKSDIFRVANGFPEDLPHNFNDVSFCLDLHGLGFHNVVAAKAELHHFEGVTRNAQGATPEVMAKLHEEGKILAKHHPEPDPYWNPNLLIMFVHNGMQIAGMDLASYASPPAPLPWTPPTFERVLYLGDPQAVLPEHHDNAAVFRLDIVNTLSTITSPPMRSSGPWDIRRPEIAARAFKALGIERVVFSSLNETSIQTLAFLNHLDLPIEYRPTTAEAVCPRGNFRPNGEDKTCDRGYTRNACQACMDTNSSPYGNVTIPAWYMEWTRFFSSGTETNISLLDKAAKEALGYIYAGEPIVDTEMENTGERPVGLDDACILPERRDIGPYVETQPSPSLPENTQFPPEGTQ